MLQPCLISYASEEGTHQPVDEQSYSDDRKKSSWKRRLLGKLHAPHNRFKLDMEGVYNQESSEPIEEDSTDNLESTFEDLKGVFIRLKNNQDQLTLKDIYRIESLLKQTQFVIKKRSEPITDPNELDVEDLKSLGLISLDFDLLRKTKAFNSSYDVLTSFEKNKRKKASFLQGISSFATKNRFTNVGDETKSDENNQQAFIKKKENFLLTLAKNSGQLGSIKKYIRKFCTINPKAFSELMVSILPSLPTRDVNVISRVCPAQIKSIEENFSDFGPQKLFQMYTSLGPSAKSIIFKAFILDTIKYTAAGVMAPGLLHTLVLSSALGGLAAFFSSPILGPLGGTAFVKALESLGVMVKDKLKLQRLLRDPDDIRRMMTPLKWTQYFTLWASSFVLQYAQKDSKGKVLFIDDDPKQGVKFIPYATIEADPVLSYGLKSFFVQVLRDNPPKSEDNQKNVKNIANVLKVICKAYPNAWNQTITSINRMIDINKDRMGKTSMHQLELSRLNLNKIPEEYLCKAALPSS